MKTASSMNLRKLNKPTALCLSLLIILSMLSFLGTTAIPVKAATTGSFDFGNTSIGTITNYFRTDRDASKFQLTQGGLLQSITAYFQTSGFNAKTAIYTDDNGVPSTLITQSASSSSNCKWLENILCSTKFPHRRILLVMRSLRYQCILGSNDYRHLRIHMHGNLPLTQENTHQHSEPLLDTKKL